MPKVTDVMYEIEEHIDKMGLSNFLQIVASICYEKSQHILESYDDTSLAKSWDSDGTKIDNLASRIRN